MDRVWFFLNLLLLFFIPGEECTISSSLGICHSIVAFMTVQVPSDLLIEPLGLKSQVLKFMKTEIDGGAFRTEDIPIINFIGIRDYNQYPGKDQLVHNEKWYLKDGELSAFGIFAILFFGLITVGILFLIGRRHATKIDDEDNEEYEGPKNKLKEVDTYEHTSYDGINEMSVVLSRGSNDGIEIIDNSIGGLSSTLFDQRNELIRTEVINPLIGNPGDTIAKRRGGTSEGKSTKSKEVSSGFLGMSIGAWMDDLRGEVSDPGEESYNDSDISNSVGSLNKDHQVINTGNKGP